MAAHILRPAPKPARMFRKRFRRLWGMSLPSSVLHVFYGCVGLLLIVSHFFFCGPISVHGGVTASPVGGVGWAWKRRSCFGARRSHRGTDKFDETCLYVKRTPGTMLPMPSLSGSPTIRYTLQRTRTHCAHILSQRTATAFQNPTVLPQRPNPSAYTQLCPPLIILLVWTLSSDFHITRQVGQRTGHRSPYVVPTNPDGVPCVHMYTHSTHSPS